MTVCPLLTKTLGTVRKTVESLPPMRKIVSHPFGERFLRDMEFRTGILLYADFALNLLYCVFQIVLSVFYQSLWARALAVFHLLLAAMRFQLLNTRGGRRNWQSTAAQWRKYRTCGVMLLCMVPFFASVLILVVHKNSGGRYAGPAIYLMAICTVYTVTLSVVNAVRFRAHPSPVLSAAKLVKLIAALMSVLSLETAMLTRFDSTDDFVFRQGMTGTTGGAVCLFVLGIAVHMVAHGTKQMRTE